MNAYQIELLARDRIQNFHREATEYRQLKQAFPEKPFGVCSCSGKRVGGVTPSISKAFKCELQKLWSGGEQV